MSSAIAIGAPPLPPGRIPLAALREDLALQPAPRGEDGAPHWNIFDAVRNKFFRIGWLEFEMLSRWQEGMAAEDLCAAVVAATPLAPDVDDVLALLQFLQSHELLRAATPARRGWLQGLAQRRQLSVWQWLLHHYLFVRVPLVKPEAFLARTLPHLEFVFRPAFLFWVGTLAVVGVVRVVDQWAEFSRTFMYFFSWQGALLYGVALALTKGVHELAHAYAAKRYGLRVPTMGVAFMVLWPLLYTDTSEGWKLDSRRARLAIDAAGVVAELLLAGLAALAWSFLPEGPLKSAAYVLAAVTWVSTLAINLNPFMRFDGYYLLMDAVDIPNLHERSFAVGRWQLRRWLLGLRTPAPEQALATRHTALMLYAYATWLYRLVVFTGIAVAVYYFFFKAAGIVLFAVEIGWFVLRPLWQEGLSWLALRPQWRGNPAARRSLAVFVLLLAALLLPWRSDIVGVGYLQADPHTRLFSPIAARLVAAPVKEGQVVRKGDALFELESPEVAWQLRAIDSRVGGIRSQLAGSVDSPGLFERARVLEQELAAAEAERSSLLEQVAALRLTAPHDGVFRDRADGLYAGAWASPHRLLGRVVGSDGIIVQVFVGESDIGRIENGAHATVFAHRAEGKPIAAVVVGIDATATLTLPEPALASTYGGPIAVRTGAKGELTANESLYRVTLKTTGSSDAAPQMALVSAHIEGERSSFLWNLGRRAAGLLIRESGF